MKIIVTDEVTGEGLALLRADPRVHLDIRLGLSKEALLGCIGEYDAIITRSGTTVDRALLDAAENLKIVHEEVRQRFPAKFQTARRDPPAEPDDGGEAKTFATP